MVINGLILALLLYLGATAKNAIQSHKYEETILIVPATPPPPAKVKIPDLPKIEKPRLPTPPEVKLEAPKIEMPKPKLAEPKPIQMEAKVPMPVMKPATPAVVLAPQPKAALAAAMPAQSAAVKPSTAPVHLGDTFGVTPNPSATRPATVSAIGNPNGGSTGPAVAPHGVVGSTGFGNGVVGGSGSAYAGSRVGSAGLSTATAAVAAPRVTTAAPVATTIEVISKPPVQYTSEARELKIQGDVVLRVTFTAGGQVVVQGILHGLGHGLDEEARRVAQQIRFHPATRNGQPVDSTTTITITFQLA
jgi:TonB family protein